MRRTKRACQPLLLAVACYASDKLIKNNKDGYKKIMTRANDREKLNDCVCYRLNMTHKTVEMAPQPVSHKDKYRRGCFGSHHAPGISSDEFAFMPSIIAWPEKVKLC